MGFWAYDAWLDFVPAERPGPSSGEWTDGNGNVTPVVALKDDHIANIISYLCRKRDRFASYQYTLRDYTLDQWVTALREEQRRRAELERVAGATKATWGNIVPDGVHALKKVDLLEPEVAELKNQVAALRQRVETVEALFALRPSPKKPKKHPSPKTPKKRPAKAGRK